MLNHWKVILIGFILGALLSGGGVYWLTRPNQNNSSLNEDNLKSQNSFTLKKPGDNDKSNKIYRFKNNQTDMKKLYDALKKGQTLTPPSGSEDQDDDFFDDDIDQQFSEMRKRMLDLFNKRFKSVDDFSFQGLGQIDELIQREDSKNIYIEMNISNVDKNSMKIDIKNGHITIQGESRVESKSENEESSSHSYFQSKFSRTIPIPKGVSESLVKVEKDNEFLKITIPKSSP